jgi:hypothetical protein
VILLSWAAALVAWPLAWLLVAVAQGIGVLAAGGGWIGVALPLGAQPWGLVNEPDVAFAARSAALWGYWLPPLVAPLLVAVGLPLLVSTPGSWLGELVIVQLSLASAILGLGWAPPLGVDDGPIAGLARFWKAEPNVVVVAAAVAAALAIQPALLRLSGHLWAAPGGPKRFRRILVALVHAALPAVGWAAAVLLVGWALPLRSWAITAAAVLAGAVGAALWVPHAPLRPGRDISFLRIAATAVVGLVVALAAAWAGAPVAGHPRALLWGTERTTSNVRPGMVRVRLLKGQASIVETPKAQEPAR